MKVIFIVNSVSATICIKRIEEFVAQGYEVEAYGFSQLEPQKSIPKNFKITTIGEYSSKSSYLDRMKVITKGVRFVINKHRSENDVIYYLYMLHVASVFRLFAAKDVKYIYEESDLRHTYSKSSFLRNTSELIDKWVIKGAMLSVFTSEGFLEYHFKNRIPKNVHIITNRLDADIEQLPKCKEKEIDPRRLIFGFVGNLRFNTIVKFSDVFCENFPDYELHFYGTTLLKWVDKFKRLEKYSNCYFHGSFLNPKDLPTIYSSIDVVLSAYDTDSANHRYAEPNKLYEAIYFNTPIIVSKGTYLSKKVNKLNVGYEVDALDKKSICDLIKSMTIGSLNEKISSCKSIDSKYCINNNQDFFDRINSLINR